MQMFVLGLVIASAFNEACSSEESPNLSFTMTPTTIVSGLTRKVNLRCDIKESFKGSVEALKITWRNDEEEKTVATVTPKSAVTTDMIDGGLVAKGSAKGRTFIALTWSKPTQMKFNGKYVCKLFATNSDSNHHDEEITIAIPTRKATVPDLTEVVRKLREEDKANKANWISLKAKLVSEQGDIEKKLDNELNHLNSKLKTCVSPYVGFMAGMKKYWKRISFKTNDQVVFDNELLDTHSSYDSSTGVFKCPVAGLYMLSLNIATDLNVAVFRVDVNNNKIGTALAKGSVSGWDTGSFSGTVKLEKGDEVKVVCGYGPSYLYQDSNTANLITFSGHLVRSKDCSL